MLTPEQIVEIVETLYPVLDELNAWITADLISVWGAVRILC